MITKNALIRYKTIDKCLQNKYKKWTLDDLMNACSDALFEFEGRQNPVSKRTVQLDIQMMRSEKLGYNAPIVVYDKKYYKYEEEDYTITDIPLNEFDISVLTETVEILKQFKNFSLFRDVSDILQRLEDKIYAEKTNTHQIIHFEKNDSLKGIHLLDDLYQAIIKKIVLVIEYQSFKSRHPQNFIFYPLILKQFNNRWFLIGKRDPNGQIINLALDRINTIDYDVNIPQLDEDFDAEAYYNDVIGVTVNTGLKTRIIELWIDNINSPYVLTKPLHHSQKILQKLDDGSIIISLFININYEFERLILGFGEGIKVLKPEKLKNRIIKKLTASLGNYEINVPPMEQK